MRWLNAMMLRYGRGIIWSLMGIAILIFWIWICFEIWRVIGHWWPS